MVEKKGDSSKNKRCEKEEATECSEKYELKDQSAKCLVCKLTAPDSVIVPVDALFVHITKRCGHAVAIDVQLVDNKWIALID